MRVLKVRVRLTGLENASTEYASTENGGADNAGTVRGMEFASTESASTVDRPGKCDYAICEYLYRPVETTTIQSGTDMTSSSV